MGKKYLKILGIDNYFQCGFSLLLIHNSNNYDEILTLKWWTLRQHG